MSTALFPSSLKGLAWPINQTELWQTRTQGAVSGKEIRLADWSAPRHRFEAQFSVLRSGASYLEWQTFVGFVNARQGGFDSFLYSNPNDSSATGSTIGTGDSTNRAFQLARALGGATEPILAPTSIAAVYVGTSLMTSTKYSVTYWGSTAPGVVTFTTFGPPTGQPVTADFVYAWPCRFDQDDMTFSEFLKRFMEVKKLSFTSIK